MYSKSSMRKTICSFSNMAASGQKLQLAKKDEKTSEKTNLSDKKPRKNRGVVWQDAATNFLIAVWGEEVIQLQLENCKTSKQTSKIYETILIQLQSKGHCEGFTARDVVNKVKKLRQKYKSEKDKKRRSGTSRGKEWKFFSKLDVFLSSKPNVEPVLVLDTMAESSRNDDVTESVETDDPIQALDSDDDVPEDVQPPCTESAESEKSASASDIKKRKRSNVEKSLDTVFKKFQENAKDDFSRLQKWEEEKMKKEHEFRIEQLALENQRRREDREHEMNLLRLLIQNPQGSYPTHPYSYPAVSIATPLPANTMSMPSTSSSYDTGNSETDSFNKKTYFSL